MKVYAIFNGNENWDDHDLEALYKTKDDAIKYVKESFGGVEYEVDYRSDTDMYFYLLDFDGKKTPSYFCITEMLVE